MSRGRANYFDRVLERCSLRREGDVGRCVCCVISRIHLRPVWWKLGEMRDATNSRFVPDFDLEVNES